MDCRMIGGIFGLTSEASFTNEGFCWIARCRSFASAISFRKIVDISRFSKGDHHNDLVIFGNVRDFASFGGIESGHAMHDEPGQTSLQRKAHPSRSRVECGRRRWTAIGHQRIGTNEHERPRAFAPRLIATGQRREKCIECRCSGQPVDETPWLSVGARRRPSSRLEEGHQIFTSQRLAAHGSRRCATNELRIRRMIESSGRHVDAKMPQVLDVCQENLILRGPFPSGSE